jgi:hypothetical protein
MYTPSTKNKKGAFQNILDMRSNINFSSPKPPFEFTLARRAGGFERK